MKILQLCHKPPLPQVDGGCIAMHNITQGLLNGGQDVKVLAVETPKHPVKMEAFPVEYLCQTRFESQFIDTTPDVREALFTRQYQPASVGGRGDGDVTNGPRPVVGRGLLPFWADDNNDYLNTLVVLTVPSL